MTDARPSRRDLLRAAVGIAGMGLLTSCAPGGTTQVARIATGERGGSYHQFGELLRRAVQSSQPLDLLVVATQGSAENLRLLDDGRVEFALTLAETARHASADIVAVGRVYQNYLQCVVRADGPVTRLSDLGARRVSIGPPGSGVAEIARRLLGALDLDDETVVSELTLDAATAALEAEAIDAFFWSGGIPTPLISALATRVPIRLLDIPQSVDPLSPATAAPIPLGVYGSERTVTTIGVPNLLVARRETPSDVVAMLVDTLIDRNRALIPPESAGTQYLTPWNLIDTAPLALHPAAAERYRARYD
ncbi:TAXI family TRAP transporter solute-binding subunit [Microbacterium sp. NPDC077184]|uniref:TAXI family TRAP transporter solute-binding subunit n=1 Tax=Microbacterium sp. NPDC077184 TaxID=3154764 RepID=UPI0034391BED